MLKTKHQTANKSQQQKLIEVNNLFEPDHGILVLNAIGTSEGLLWYLMQMVPSKFFFWYFMYRLILILNAFGTSKRLILVLNSNRTIIGLFWFLIHIGPAKAYFIWYLMQMVPQRHFGT